MIIRENQKGNLKYSNLLKNCTINFMTSKKTNKQNT